MLREGERVVVDIRAVFQDANPLLKQQRGIIVGMSGLLWRVQLDKMYRFIDTVALPDSCVTSAFPLEASAARSK
jgi:hypothetical protein